LWKKFEDYKETERIRTKGAIKKVPGGNFIFKGSNAKARKSDTSPFMVLDEIGEMPEGAVSEFMERTKAFDEFYPKVVGVSTIVHPKDEICTHFDSCSVKIEWHFICMKCKNNFYPDEKYFKFISKKDYLKENNLDEDTMILNKYIDEVRKTVHVECPHCSHKITTSEKREMVLNDYMDWFIKKEDGSYEVLEVEKLTTEASFGADMNSLGSLFVKFETLADKIVREGDSEAKLDKIYRNWFNRFYKKKIKQADQSDMLLLGNNIDEWVVPPDTQRIYVTIDNQINYFYAQVTAFGYGVNPHVMYFERIESWNDVEDLWEKCQYLESADGDTHMASAMMIDRRGYNENGVSRTDEADDFIDYMTRKWGEDRVYAGEGHPSITGNKALEVKNLKDTSSKRKELKVKVIKFSNIYIKDMLFRMIDRTILKVKAEKEEDEGFFYTEKLFYINQTLIDQDMQGTTAESITRMLRAEVLDYAVSKAGKVAVEKSYVQIHKRNDAIDTSSMAIALSIKDKLAMDRKPSTKNIKAKLAGLGSLGS